jgi:hypothetical protein
MRKRMVATVLAATATLVLAVATATATRLQVNARAFHLAWSGLTFSGRGFEESPIQMSCRVTLAAVFASSTLVKSGEPRAAELTPANLLWECEGGSLTVLTPGIWDMKYVSFAGTLPSVSAVTLSVAKFAWLLNINNFISCLYEFRAEAPGKLRFDVSAGAVTGATFIESVMPRRSGSFLCPPEVSVSGTARVTGPSGEGATIRLI